MGDTPGDKSARLDIVGTVLSALGLALVVFGVLSSGTWGFIIAKPGAPEWLGLSPVIWLVLVGGCVLSGFLGWERRRLGRGQGVLVDPAILDNRLLRGGLVSFFFQYLLQAGLFFVVPLFCRSRSGCRLSPRVSSCFRCLSPCCSPRSECRRCSRTHPRAAWCVSASSLCSPVPSS
jgi:hypothetical protein